MRNLLGWRTALVLFVVWLLTGCLHPMPAVSPGLSSAPTAASQSVPSIVGHVEHFSYQVQASTIKDIAVGSTVSLIDSVTNLTTASTVTDSSGGFTLAFGAGFHPSSNVYYLEAYKGLPVGGTPNRAGVSMARVRTLIVWDSTGNQWKTITAYGVTISPATTALSVIVSLRSASGATHVDARTLMGSVQGSDSSVSFTPGISGVSSSEFTTVLGLVNQALLIDSDPLYRITYDINSGNYYVTDKGIAITSVAPLAGPMGTTVTVLGSNLGTNPIVRFNGTVAPSSVNNVYTQVTATVPVGATSGPVTVQVGTIVYNGANFSVSPWDGHNVFDAQGNMYVSSSQDNRIYKFDPSGKLSLLSQGGLLNYPRGLVVDPTGVIYVANWSASNILRIDQAGNQSVYASGGGLSNPWQMTMSATGDLYVTNWSGNNILKIASGSPTPQVYATGAFPNPYGIAMDATGSLYVTNYYGGTLIRVLPNGTTQTVMAGLSNPAGVCLDSSGNTYVACYGTQNVYRISPAGAISYFAYTPNYPSSIAIHPNGTIYVASTQYGYIQKLDPSGHSLGYWSSGHLTWSLKSNPTTNDLYVASGLGWGAYTRTVYKVPYDSAISDYDQPTPLFTGVPNPSALAYAGPNTMFIGDWGGLIFRGDPTTGNYTTYAAGLGNISDLTLDGSGNLYAADWSSHCLRKFSGGSQSNVYGYSWYYNNAVFGPDGYLYVPDYWAGKVLRVSPTGVVTTYSNNNGSGFGNPHGLAFDTSGNLYVSSWSWNAIYKIATGSLAVTTYATGMSQPNGLAFDASGSLYVSNWSDSTIKKVTTGGAAVSTFASLPSGSNPRGLAIDSSGNLYAPCWNGNVAQVSPGGAVTATYGTGVGQAMQAFVDTDGSLLIASYSDRCVYRIPVGGGTATRVYTSTITTVGGVVKDTAGNMYVLNWDWPTITKVPAGSTKGRIFASSLVTPAGVAVTSDGLSAYVTDWSAGVLFKVDLTSGGIAIAAQSRDWPCGSTTLKGVAFDPAGSLYVATWGGGIFKLNPATINPNDGTGVSPYGDNNAGAGVLGGIAFGANGNLYGTTYTWVGNGSTPITYRTPNGGAGGPGTNMKNWPNLIAF